MIKWQPCFHFYLAILLRTEANKEALVKSAPNNSIQINMMPIMLINIEVTSKMNSLLFNCYSSELKLNHSKKTKSYPLVLTVQLRT